MKRRSAMVLVLVLGWVWGGCSKEPEDPTASVPRWASGGTVLADYDEVSEREGRTGTVSTPATSSSRRVSGGREPLAGNAAAGQPSHPENAEVSRDPSSGDSVYRNDYFGFTLVIPERWHVFAGEAIRERTRRLAGTGRLDAEARRALDSALLVVSKSRDWASPGAGNSNLTLMADDLSAFGLPEGENEEALARQAMTQLKQTVNNSAELHELRLGGRAFYRWDVSTDQSTIMTILKGHHLLFMLTAFTEADMKELDGIVHSIAFPGGSRAPDPSPPEQHGSDG